MTTEQFKTICEKYGLEVKYLEEDESWEAYIPGVQDSYDDDDEDVESFIDYDPEEASVMMYTGINVSYEYESGTSYSYTETDTEEYEDPDEFEKVLSSIMHRFIAYRLVEKKYKVEDKITSAQQDF